MRQNQLRRFIDHPDSFPDGDFKTQTRYKSLGLARDLWCMSFINMRVCVCVDTWCLVSHLVDRRWCMDPRCAYIMCVLGGRGGIGGLRPDLRRVCVQLPGGCVCTGGWVCPGLIGPKNPFCFSSATIGGSYSSCLGCLCFRFLRSCAGRSSSTRPTTPLWKTLA